MKRIRINLAIIAVILAVTAAFAFKPVSPTVSRFSTNYYAVADNLQGTAWHWVTTQPAGKSCSDGSATCEINTTVSGMPPANGFPSSYTVIQGVDQASVYK